VHGGTLFRSLNMRLPFQLMVAIALLAAPPAPSQEQSRSIQGRVRTMSGSPIPADVTVYLEAAEGVQVGKQMVGSDGRFEFHDLKGTLYRIVVTAEGYQTARQDVDMDYLASRYPDIYLVALQQKKSDHSAAPTSVTDLAAPSKARKEYEKGRRALQDANPAQARTHLEKAVAEYRCYARAQTALGVALSMQNELAAAESAFKKALECDSGFIEAYAQQGILFNQEHRYTENEASLRRALARFPNQWELYYQLAVAHDGLKNYEKAIEEYLKVEALNPAPPPDVHVKLADDYLKQKEYGKAYAEMQAYLRVDPKGEFAAETRSLMQRMEAAGVVPAAERKAAR
jgi:tetratricopeptide (TPR) repeat protein